MAKANVTIELETPHWDRYVNKTPDDALKQLYGDAIESSNSLRGWYWAAIKGKRFWSVLVRSLAYVFLAAGSILPLVAGIFSDVSLRLTLTQAGIVLLAAAGLLQFGDKAFGLSSGWMRYVTAVTAMESATSIFRMDWAKCLLFGKNGPTDEDVKNLFTITDGLVRDLDKLRTDETNRWAADFNAGIALLDSQIKAKSEEAQKQLDALAKANEPGAINVAVKLKPGAQGFKVQLDGGAQLDATGSLKWVFNGVQPGIHKIAVETFDNPPQRDLGLVCVESGKIANIELDLKGN